jgi:hypothetical protein
MINNRTFPRSRVHLDSLSRGKVESESFFSYICATLPNFFCSASSNRCLGSRLMRHRSVPLISITFSPFVFSTPNEQPHNSCFFSSLSDASALHHGPKALRCTLIFQRKSLRTWVSLRSTPLSFRSAAFDSQERLNYIFHSNSCTNRLQGSHTCCLRWRDDAR